MGKHPHSYAGICCRLEGPHSGHMHLSASDFGESCLAGVVHSPQLLAIPVAEGSIKAEWLTRAGGCQCAASSEACSVMQNSCEFRLSSMGLEKSMRESKLKAVSRIPSDTSWP